MIWTKDKNFIKTGKDGFTLRVFTKDDSFIRLKDFFPPSVFDTRIAQLVRLDGSLGRPERSQNFNMTAGDCIRMVVSVNDGCGGKADLSGVDLVWKFLENDRGMTFFEKDNFDVGGIQVVHNNEHLAIIDIVTEDTIDADGLYFHTLTQIHEGCRNTLLTGKVRVFGSPGCGHGND